GAVERVIDEKEFNDAISCVEHSFACDVLHNHSIHHIGAAACNELGHGARVGGGASGNFHETGSALTAASLQLAVVAHSRRGNIAADLPCGIEDRCSRRNFNRDVVDRYLE